MINNTRCLKNIENHYLIKNDYINNEELYKLKKKAYELKLLCKT